MLKIETLQNCHFNMMEGFEYLHDPGVYVIWGISPLCGLQWWTGLKGGVRLKVIQKPWWIHRSIRKPRPEKGNQGTPIKPGLGGECLVVESWLPKPSPQETQDATSIWAHQEGCQGWERFKPGSRRRRPPWPCRFLAAQTVPTVGSLGWGAPSSRRSSKWNCYSSASKW